MITEDEEFEYRKDSKILATFGNFLRISEIRTRDQKHLLSKRTLLFKKTFRLKP